MLVNQTAVKSESCCWFQLLTTVTSDPYSFLSDCLYFQSGSSQQHVLLNATVRLSLDSEVVIMKLCGRLKLYEFYFLF